MQLHRDVISPVILGTTAILFFAVIGRLAWASPRYWANWS